MKLSDLVAQLSGVLPKYTDKFSRNIDVTLAYSGGLVTATSATAHGYVTNDYTTITDAPFPTSVTSITRTGNIATVTTDTNHDLTLGFNDAVIADADQPEYNGTHTPLTVPNRRTFTFSVSGSPATPATGTILLNEDRLGYKGRHQVTRVSDTVFTYPITQTPANPSAGKAKGLFRISGAINYERARELYTKQAESNLWCFAVPAQSTIARNRATQGDVNDYINSAASTRIQETENFAIYIFAPSIDETGQAVYDEIDDISPLIYKSLVGVKLPSGVNEDRPVGITPLSNSPFDYSASFYVHVYEFQMMRFLTQKDKADDIETVAFRNTTIDSYNQFGEVATNINIDLDETPV